MDQLLHIPVADARHLERLRPCLRRPWFLGDRVPASSCPRWHGITTISCRLDAGGPGRTASVATDRCWSRRERTGAPGILRPGSRRPASARRCCPGGRRQKGLAETWRNEALTPSILTVLPVFTASKSASPRGRFRRPVTLCFCASTPWSGGLPGPVKHYEWFDLWAHAIRRRSSLMA